MAKSFKDLLGDRKLLPIAHIDNAADAPRLAEALLASGIDILEITYRTDAALDAITAITSRMDMTVGLGTVLEADHFQFAGQVGAKFVTSPGLNINLLAMANAEHLTYLPSVFTASEIMLARDLEYDTMKYFPAYTGGILSPYPQLAVAFPNLKFCLTGGIDHTNFVQTLALRGVLAIGGSWLASRQLIRDGNWSEITARAKFARDTINSEQETSRKSATDSL